MAFFSTPEVLWLYSGVTITKPSNEAIFSAHAFVWSFWYCPSDGGTGSSRGGPGRLTMDAVACEARVGKGTIFRRFGDRDGLAGALLDADMRAFQDGFLHGPPPLGPGAPARERLEAFVVGLLRHLASHLNVPLLAA